MSGLDRKMAEWGGSIEAEKVVWGCWIREERDAVISTAEMKLACRDKDKLRRRETEIRGQLDIFEERCTMEAEQIERWGARAMKERDHRSVFMVPRGSASSRYGNQHGQKRSLVNKAKLTWEENLWSNICSLGILTSSMMWFSSISDRD